MAFARALHVRGDDVASARALPLELGGQPCAYVAHRVTVRGQVGEDAQVVDGGEKPVPHILESARPGRTVERESRVLFDNAQRLARSVIVGVDYAEYLRA
jgi:hypothetical protein